MENLDTAATDGGQTQEVKAEVVTTTKAKVKATGNLIADTAADVEKLTKTKALKEADVLAENIEANYFRLGGVLALIKAQTWFDGYESFAFYVFEKFGFKERKADYLIRIYDNLVTKQIPWEKVSILGWTKLKDLTDILTVDNVDEWVAKASTLTVLELQAAIAAKPAEDGGKTTNASDGIEKMVFKFKSDQKTTVDAALNKAKAEGGTEHDTVAIEMICANFLSGGTLTNSSKPTMDVVLNTFGFEELLNAVSQRYPEFDIQAGPKGTLAAVAE